METRPDRTRRDLLDVAIPILLLGWFCFNWYSTVSHILRYYNPLPVSDYWRVIEDLPAFEAGNFGWLWRQHNEHRIIFPEIIFALDQIAFAGRQVLPLLVSFFCYAGTVLLLGRAFWREARVPAHMKMQALLLGGAIAGWPVSTFVLATPFLLQWTLLQLAVVLALVSVSKLARQNDSKWLALSIGSGVVATFSSANGLLLWFILLTISVIVRVPRRSMIAIAVSAAISGGLFFVDYQRPAVQMIAAARHPIYCVGFVLSYLSMPFGVLRNPAIGIVFGTAALALWLMCLAQANRSRGHTIPVYQIVGFGYAGLLLLTATLTSAGRLDLADLGFSSAKAARYVTLSLLAWAVLAPLVLACAYRAKWRTLSPHVILLMAALVVAFMQIRLGRWLRTNDDYVAHQQLAALSLQNGLFDPASIGSVFPKQAFIDRYLPILRSGHKSIFAEPDPDYPGQPFRSIFPHADSGIESGGVLKVTPIEGGLSVVGWALNLNRGGRTTIVFVDGAGTIVGFGRRLRAGIPRELIPLTSRPADTWLGFINMRYRSTSFVPYLAEPKTGSAAPVAPRTMIPRKFGSVPAV